MSAFFFLPFFFVLVVPRWRSCPACPTRVQRAPLVSEQTCSVALWWAGGYPGWPGPAGAPPPGGPPSRSCGASCDPQKQDQQDRDPRRGEEPVPPRPPLPQSYESNPPPSVPPLPSLVGVRPSTLHRPEDRKNGARNGAHSVRLLCARRGCVTIPP